MAGDSRNGRGPGNGNSRKVRIAKGPKNGKGFEEWQGVTGMAGGPRNDGRSQVRQGASGVAQELQAAPRMARGPGRLGSRESRRVQVFSGFFLLLTFFLDFSSIFSRFLDFFSFLCFFVSL